MLDLKTIKKNAAENPPEVIVSMRRWGGDLRVVAIDSPTFFKIRELDYGDDKTEYMVELIANSAHGDNGLLFKTEEDRQWLREQPMGELDQIVKGLYVAMGLDDDEEEADNSSKKDMNGE